MITAEQKIYLQDLAKQVKEIANDPIQQERMQRWKNLNSLEKGRPLVQFIPAPQIMPFFVPEDTMIFRDGLLYALEKELKWRVFKTAHFHDDEPIVADLHVALHKTVTPWMETQQTVRMGLDFSSSHFEPCLVEYGDFKKMQYPKLVIDWEKSNADYEVARDLLGDILDIKQGKPFDQTCGWGESMIDELVEMRGLEQVYVDIYENPGFIHEIMEFMTRGKLRLMDQYIEQEALCLNNKGNFLGSCGLAYCDELPGEPFDAEKIRPHNLWGFAQAQEFSSVSPDTLDEFVLPYEARLVEDFGLLLYGCCEPMENNIEKVEKRFGNLRAFSIGPFTNHEKAADKIKGKYVYTWKQNPSYIASYNPDLIEKEVNEVFNITKDCHVAIVLMDTYDFGGDITRLQNWIDTAVGAANRSA